MFMFHRWAASGTYCGRLCGAHNRPQSGPDKSRQTTCRDHSRAAMADWPRDDRERNRDGTGAAGRDGSGDGTTAERQGGTAERPFQSQPLRRRHDSAAAATVTLEYREIAAETDWLALNGSGRVCRGSMAETRAVRRRRRRARHVWTAVIRRGDPPPPGRRGGPICKSRVIADGKMGSCWPLCGRPRVSPTIGTGFREGAPPARAQKGYDETDPNTGQWDRLEISVAA